MKLQEGILFSAQESIRAVSFLTSQQAQHFLFEVSHLLAKTFQKGGKVLIAGNGGSLCDANHFAEELSGRFRANRKALPAIALSEPGYLTCVANDYGFSQVFQRGVEAFGKEGDVFIALSTSGNSENLILATDTAKRLSMKTVAFLGKNGGKLLGMCDYELHVPDMVYSDKIQEVHMSCLHILVEAIEAILFQGA
jgi:D-sedoheptulose 7-phosphate isomerase